MWHHHFRLDQLAARTRGLLAEPADAACGLVIDRDVNAARNLLQLAVSGTESQNACGGTVRPGLAGLVPVNQEPGTALAGQTGTAAGQLAAAV